MPSTPFTRGADLRHRIEQCMPGGTIHLEPGHEYEGPFFFHKPVTLVGHGGATQLFARGGPAAVVLSPGVRLEHLGLVDSFDPVAGTCLVAERSAFPVLVDVRAEGLVATVTRDQVV